MSNNSGNLFQQRESSLDKKSTFPINNDIFSSTEFSAFIGKTNYSEQLKLYIINNGDTDIDSNTEEKIYNEYIENKNPFEGVPLENFIHLSLEMFSINDEDKKYLETNFSKDKFMQEVKRNCFQHIHEYIKDIFGNNFREVPSFSIQDNISQTSEKVGKIL